MKRYLHLFDMSNYIAAGFATNKTSVIANGTIESNERYVASQMPIGGVAFALNILSEINLDECDVVFCFDRPPAYKRDLHKATFVYMNGYKGNRTSAHPSIKYQRDLTEEILKQCGLMTMSFDEYESDDIIASLVEKYKFSYERVHIHSKDSDLFYLVDPTVVIDKVGETGKLITASNWDFTVKKDYVVPYNTLTINKLIDGEMGDNIPAISKEMADRIMAFIPESGYPACGHLDVLRRVIDKAVGGDEVVMTTFDLIVPRAVPPDDLVLFDTEFDKDVFKFYAIQVKNKYYKSHKPFSNPLGEETLNRFIGLYMGRE